MMVIYSERDNYVGAHVTPQFKLALRHAAFCHRMSMSKLVAKAIQEMLDREPGTESVDTSCQTSKADLTVN